ncbi:MAG: hypothetical protein ACSLFP_08655 [Acidimicrobiales bacterium]
MTERAYRLLLRAYPRSLRDAHGEEMVTLVRERAGDGDGEPWWRLWPALLSDTARGATSTVAVGAMAAVDRELTEIEWALVFFAFVAGLFLTATGLALLAGSRQPAES